VCGVALIWGLLIGIDGFSESLLLIGIDGYKCEFNYNKQENQLLAVSSIYRSDSKLTW